MNFDEKLKKEIRRNFGFDAEEEPKQTKKENVEESSEEFLL